MVSPIIKSALRAGIDKLPDDFKTKGRSLPNLLNKIGVKDEEAQFQLGITRPESYGEQDLTQVSKADLEQAVSNQQGEFGVETSTKHSNLRNLPGGAANPTYRENVYTFKQKGVKGPEPLSAEQTENLQEGIAAFGDYPDNDEVFLEYAESLGWSGNQSVDDWLASMPTTRDVDSKRLAIAEAFENPESDALYAEFPEATVIEIAEGIADGRTVEELQGLFASSTGSRYTSSHYGEIDNYLMHTATLTDTIGGKNTHVIMELQSDLHQAGRQQGYRGNGLTEPEKAEVAALARAEELGFEELTSEQMSRIEYYLNRYGMTDERMEQLDQPISEVLDSIAQGKVSDVPESPYKNSWLSKSIEREIAVAIDEGVEQIAIPIKGELSDLKRGTISAGGVQKWYEDKVLGTAKKIAKANDMDFKMVTEGGLDVDVTKDSTLIMNTMRTSTDKASTLSQLEEAFPNLSARDIKDVASADSISHANSIIEAGIVKAKRQDVAFTIVNTFRTDPADVSVVQARLEQLYPEVPPSLIDRIRLTGSKTMGARMLEEAGYGADKTIEYAVITPKRTEGAFIATTEEIQEQLAKGTEGPSNALVDAGFERGEIDSALPEGYNNVVAALRNEPEAFLANLTSTKRGVQAVRPEFSLYSVEMSGILMAYEASKFGYTEEQVTAELVKKGYSEEESKQAATQAKQAVESGATKEELQAFLTEQEPQFESRQSEPKSPAEPPEEGTRIGDAYRKLFGEEDYSPAEFMAMMQVVAPDSSFITTNISGWLGNEESRRISDQAAKKASDSWVSMMQDRGMTTRLNHETGSFEVQDEATQKWEPLSAGIWDSIWGAKFEGFGVAAGTLMGARIGASAGAVAGSLMPVVGTTVGGLGAGLVGAVIGGYTGALAGTEADYMHASMLLAEDMNAEVMARKVFTVAEFEAIAGVASVLGIKIAGKSWNGIKRAKDYLFNNSVTRGRVALKEVLFVDDDEADMLLDALGSVAKVPGKTRSEQEIAAAVLTKPGGEAILAGTKELSPKTLLAVNKSISVRAEDLLQATAEVSDANVGRLLKGELEAYTSAVKENFARVKKQAAQAPRANSFRFKFDALALDPVFERLGKNIDNPDVAYKFAKQVEKIRDMSSTRSFGDLLELRTLVNEFKYNKRIRSAKDFDMLNDVLGRIDSTINTAAHVTLDNPKQWLSEFSSARTSYKQMKELEKNVIMKIVARPGVDETVIAKSLTKYATALGDTFVEAMAILPKASKAKVEGAVLHNLADKHTMGLEGGMKATNFPELANALNNITFSSKNARGLKSAISQLAEVFRNDLPLSNLNASVHGMQKTSAMTDDITKKTSFAIVTKIFNYAQSFTPGQLGRQSALLRAAAKVLENPVHAKSIQELTEALEGEIDIQPLLEQLVMDTARRKAATSMVGMPKLKLYGDGAVLTTKGKGAQQSVPMHRIASLEDARTISEVTGINQSDRKALDHALKQRGYSAVQLGTNSVRKIK